MLLRGLSEQLVNGSRGVVLEMIEVTDVSIFFFYLGINFGIKITILGISVALKRTRGQLKAIFSLACSLGRSSTSNISRSFTKGLFDFFCFALFSFRRLISLSLSQLPVVQFSNNKTHVVMPESFGMAYQHEEYVYRIQVPLKLAWSLTIHKCQVSFDGSFEILCCWMCVTPCGSLSPFLSFFLSYLSL